jgi:hypothetical protein
MTDKNKAIRVDTPKKTVDDLMKDKDDFKGKTKKEKEKSAKRFVDTVQTMMAKKRSETEGSFAKGGRAGFKAGSKGCKLAKRGRGRAYGKNS